MDYNDDRIECDLAPDGGKDLLIAVGRNHVNHFAAGIDTKIGETELDEPAESQTTVGGADQIHAGSLKCICVNHSPVGQMR